VSKVVVTGGAGFIGSNLAEALVEEGHRVVVVDDLSTGRMENLHTVSIELVGEASPIWSCSRRRVLLQNVL